MKILFMILFLFSNFAFASEIEKTFKKQSSIKDPFQMRDPFQAPKFKSSSNRRIKQRAKGILNNIPSLEEEFNLEGMIIVGILIGKERRVMIRVKDNKNIYTLKEGDTFGRNGPEIKAILPGGVILVEKITNVYGESEFIETVVPISK